MKKVIINEVQKGLLFKNGKFVKLLDAGKYYIWGDSNVEILSIDNMLQSKFCSLEFLLQQDEIAKQVSVVDVANQQLAFHFVDGKYVRTFEKGKYAFWNALKEHTYQIVDISDLMVGEDVPDWMFQKIPSAFYTEVTVAYYEKAGLYLNQKFERLLDAGVYRFWKNNINVKIDFVDTRLTQMNVNGQELLTQDKVTIRINFVCNYRIVDYVKILTEVDNYEEQLHVAAQLALREYVGKHKLDEILDKKEEISQYVLQALQKKAPMLFVEIVDGGVKDIVLPGEIRDIMNTVLVAEKRAQASVITRREEVASTRSLLNTAKLMEENQTLYKLKELEYIERICSNVGNINLNNSGDILAQLSNVLHGSKTS